MIDVSTLGPLMLGVGLMFSMVSLLGKESRIARVFCAAVCVVMACRYAWWRVEYSLPTEQSALQHAWSITFLVFELCAMISSITLFGFLSRKRNRSADADARTNSHLHKAPVDVFIATYNETYAILERTIVGAKSIDHEDLRVWVLDDGARTWVRDLAVELGALYVCRVKGKHAKAGNVNNGLQHAITMGRRPEFILLLDADFVANRRILKRTLGLFEEADVGIVQTPQHFFNPDPIQTNLLVAGAWPDEQRFFFNTLLESKDAWGAAFCCGTSAIFRTDALVAAGGMAVETVTEDMLTTFKFEEYGYRTIFLNENLSLGLAPEGIKEYVSQRSRWCLGAIQQVYTRWSFAGCGKIGLVSRLSSLDGTLFWMFTFPFKLMMISSPLVYWWTGTAVVNSSAADLVSYLAPSAVASMVFMAIYAKNRVMPVMTDVTQMISAIPVMTTVVTGLVKPWGHPFKVTAKGVNTDGITIQWNFMLPFAFMAIGTLLGIVINISAYSGLRAGPGYAMNVFWSVFNIAVLALAAAVSIELPKRRADERFLTNETAVITTPDGTYTCEVKDISLGGARLHGSVFGTARAGDAGIITFDQCGAAIPYHAVRMVGGDLAIHFDKSAETRRAMIAKLFTGDYTNEIQQISPLRVLGRLAHKILD